MVTPKLAPLPKSAVELEPPPIPNWDGAPEPPSWIDARWEHASQKGFQRRAASPAPAVDDERSRSRARNATIVVAGLIVVFLAVATVMFLLNRSPRTASSPRTAPSAAVTPSDTVSTAAIAHVQAATSAAISATATARTNLRSLTGFPTPDKVAAVMNPYVSSLQRYATVLTDTDTPAAARTSALSALMLVTRDVQVLDTINGLAPVRLGSYLEDFGTNASRLMTTLNTMERQLHSPRS
jgi:hypothetical protein